MLNNSILTGKIGVLTSNTLLMIKKKINSEYIFIYKKRHLEEIHYNYMLVIMLLSQNDLNKVFRYEYHTLKMTIRIVLKIF